MGEAEPISHATSIARGIWSTVDRPGRTKAKDGLVRQPTSSQRLRTCEAACGNTPSVARSTDRIYRRRHLATWSTACVGAVKVSKHLAPPRLDVRRCFLSGPVACSDALVPQLIPEPSFLPAEDPVLDDRGCVRSRPGLTNSQQHIGDRSRVPLYPASRASPNL